MNQQQPKKSFFATLPGVLTALAAVITATAGLVKVLKEEPPNVIETQQPVNRDHTEKPSEIKESETKVLHSEVTNDENISEDLNSISNSNELNSSKPVWKQLNRYYYIYLNGEQIAGRTNSVYVNEDLLVFDPVSKTHYLLKNYDNRNDNQLRKVEVLESKSGAFWRRKGHYFWIYKNGKEVQYPTMPWQILGNEEDCIAFDENNNITYLMPDYEIYKDNKLRPAKIINSPSNTFWMKNKKGEFWFYKNGVAIHNKMKTYFDGAHLMAFDNSTGISYKLKNFKTTEPFKLTPGILVN